MREGWHPQSRFVDLGGLHAHYVEVGAGAPVLLLHGILVSSWAFRRNLEPLGSRFRVLALCQLGHGWSAKPPGRYRIETLSDFVLRFMDAKGLDRVDVCGCSLGGTVSLRLAVHHPDRIRRMVLVNPAAVPLRPSLHAFLSIQRPFTAPFYRAIGKRALFQQVLRVLAYRRLPVDAEYMRWFMMPFRDPMAMAACVSAARFLPEGIRDLFPHLEKVHHHVQLVFGGSDVLVPLREGLILNRVLRSSRLEVFDGCGHCPMEEAPDRFNRLAWEFLSRPDP